ncbi:hypothetical protein [Cellulosimicrobium cellulans]|uniref:hypothetical protein n=1 Tax=Cellulosimicrobium cellulans TaxID=1710 RepID=UPI002405337F|nr:hypothetical protein [Cellulosimicrobium cellulans]MDF9875563.1 hypothetical protein [Cellulosimicrobium cellulans]
MTPAPLTGDRATRKVRHWAEASRLGRLRHVESATPNGPAWAVTAALVLLAPVASLLDGEPVIAAALLVSVAAVLGLLLWFLGSEKLLVLDGGIVVGSFAPFLRPTVIPWSGLDARTVTAVVGNQRTIGLLLADRGVGGASRTVLWSRRPVTFIAVSPLVARHAWAQGRPVDLATAPGFDLWVFSTRRPSRQEPLVRAIAAAMHDARVPGADAVMAHALPPRRLRSTVEDADHLGIPERFRRAPLRRA